MSSLDWSVDLKVTIVGFGYAGLVSGACLVEIGNHFLCLDLDQDKIATLKNSWLSIHEPNLLKMIRRNFAVGRPVFTTDIDKAVVHGRIQFVAVGTPSDNDGSVDLQYVFSVARNIGSCITEIKIPINKSTVPVGITDKASALVAEELRKQKPISRILHSFQSLVPQRRGEVEDFRCPDHIIFGSDHPYAIEKMRKLHGLFSRNQEHIIVMKTMLGNVRIPVALEERIS